MSTNQLLRFGILAALSFWITILGCGYLLGYNQLTGSVSEIGAVGTSTQSLYTGGIMLCAVFSALFALGLYNACREMGVSAAPAFIPFTFPISMFGVALFPTPQPLHGVFGVISMLMHLAPLVAFLLWRRNSRLSGIRVISLAVFFWMAISITSFFPTLQTEFPGLIVRFFHMGWSFWYILLSLCLIRLRKSKDKSEALQVQLA